MALRRGRLFGHDAREINLDLRVVLLSVTEGEDKPLKYPVLFRKADLVLITKTDLADAVGADMPALRENIRRIAPTAVILELSARSGNGLDAWYNFLLKAISYQRLARPG